MNKTAAFGAEYVDWKLVKTRAAIQIVFEIPLEAADHAYRVLGGMPDNSKSRWFGIARMEHDEQPKAGSSKGRTSDFESENEGSNPSPAAKWSTLTPAQQAGILCNDPAFEKFMSEVHNFTHADVPLMVRQHCNVDSRKDILPDSYAGRRWRELVSDYRAWCREPEVV